jgi:hypothetical protein
MLPIYVLFFVGIAWAFLVLDESGDWPFGWASLFLLLPLLLPLWTTGQRRWKETET